MERRFFTVMLGLLFYAISAFPDNIDWEYDPHAYQYDMTVYVGLQVDGTSVQDLSRYTVAAFYNDECRGIVEKKTIGNYSYGYLRIRSNKSQGESITFKVYDTQTGKMAKCNHSIEFLSQDVAGLPSSPFIIEAYNLYKVNFVADEHIIEASFYYGDPILQPDAPEKEGYTFIGWQDVPETMPSHDIEIIGTYNINKYALVYYIDNEKYRTDSVAYGETIVLVSDPVKDGYVFSGWSDVPETMPAYDIRVDGSFIMIENELFLDENVVSDFEDGHYDKVILQRHIASNTWSTFVVPFSMAIPNGWEVKELAEETVADDNYLHLRFKDAAIIEAGKPYMVRTPEEVSNIEEENVDVTKNIKNVQIGNVKFIGTYVPGFVPQGNYFISNNLFYYAVDQTNTLKGFRAYISVDSSLQVNGIRFSTEDDDVLGMDESVLGPVIVKEIYDLNGIRQNRLKKGMNILKMSDGVIKKVLIKN